MAKQKIFIAGETFDVTKHLAIAELLIQDRFHLLRSSGQLDIKRVFKTELRLRFFVFEEFHHTKVGIFSKNIKVFIESCRI